MRNEKEALEAKLKEATSEIIRYENDGVKVVRRVNIVEEKVRVKIARIDNMIVKMDDMSYAFHTAFRRAQDRVYYYHVEYV